MSAFDSYRIYFAAQLLSSAGCSSAYLADQGSATSAWLHCMQMQPLLLVRAPDMRHATAGHWPLATCNCNCNWQLVNDYQFVINGQADRCWPRPKMCICDSHNKSVESGNGGVAQSERGGGRAGGKLAKNGSKCWHCRRPLVDANRV